MKRTGPSLTARGVAASRAAHQLLDQPVVMDDPIAVPIIGREDADRIALGGRLLDNDAARALRAFVVARARFAEAELGAAIERGVGQFVVLGAGLDTFAYRNPYPAARLRVFEVDHPNTQAWKRERLAEAGIQEPSTLRYVSCDFEHQDLATELRAAGFERDKPAFFSWLGVSMYLEHEVVMDMMRFFRSLPAGSGVVFDYLAPVESVGFLRQILIGMMTVQLAWLGEPWKSYFDPAGLVEALRALDFSHVSDLGPSDLNAMYFPDRPEQLMAGGLGHMLTVRV
ncbi:class I SAM-dependent methyltransferase [Variovorax sp. dw_308]|uniref:class I SAM-dependent methyltransferase n=1 Tax=Variovorax sp. dw_308 TaxID=2721546 RepID=UPI001C47627F|nr:class I SAM-dependent methyltransferase [Variovorax sp. dw_308]